MCRWGIDVLLTYHYLVAEVMRYVDMPYAKFWVLKKEAQAEMVFKTLFTDRSPVSESCRGVITCLSRLGADPNSKSIDSLRKFYHRYTMESFNDTVLRLANIDHIYMTNDPLDSTEMAVWKKGHEEDPPFHQEHAGITEKPALCIFSMLLLLL